MAKRTGGKAVIINSGRFPSDFPDGCPPAGAEDAGGQVFRLVRSNPPTMRDFKTHCELGKMPKAPPCLRAGLSVFRERDDALHQQALLPHLGDFLAACDLATTHGQLMATRGKQPSHHTWWPYRGVARTSVVASVESVA